MSSKTNFWDPANVESILLEGIYDFFPNTHRHILEEKCFFEVATPKEEGEISCGTMGALEKTLFTLTDICMREMCLAVSTGPEKAPGLGKGVFFSVNREELRQYLRLSNLLILFTDLFSVSISSNLDQKKFEREMGSYKTYIRSGFEIVLTTEKIDDTSIPVRKVSSEEQLGKLLVQGLLEGLDLKTIGLAEWNSPKFNYEEMEFIGNFNQFQVLVHKIADFMWGKLQETEGNNPSFREKFTIFDSLLKQSLSFSFPNVNIRQGGLFLCQEGILAKKKLPDQPSIMIGPDRVSIDQIMELLTESARDIEKIDALEEEFAGSDQESDQVPTDADPKEPGTKKLDWSTEGLTEQ